MHRSERSWADWSHPRPLESVCLNRGAFDGTDFGSESTRHAVVLLLRYAKLSLICQYKIGSRAQQRVGSEWVISWCAYQLDYR